MIKDEIQADIATLDQESRQMRARMNRIEKERDQLLSAMRKAVVAGAHPSIQAKEDCYNILDEALRASTSHYPEKRNALHDDVYVAGGAA